uniref:Uncharacterized protein n=1 Tax=Anopheles culicifacies TaxID=139723 RepID=A0A182LSM7_9DIPT
MWRRMKRKHYFGGSHFFYRKCTVTSRREYDLYHLVLCRTELKHLTNKGTLGQPIITNYLPQHRTDGKFVKTQRHGTQTKQQFAQTGRRSFEPGRMCIRYWAYQRTRPGRSAPDVPKRYTDRTVQFLRLLLPAVVTEGGKRPLGKLFQLVGFPFAQSVRPGATRWDNGIGAGLSHHGPGLKSHSDRPPGSMD